MNSPGDPNFLHHYEAIPQHNGLNDLGSETSSHKKLVENEEKSNGLNIQAKYTPPTLIMPAPGQDLVQAPPA